MSTPTSPWTPFRANCPSNWASSTGLLTASISASIGDSGSAPAASTASASMKLAYRSAILAASVPGGPSARVVMMTRTASSAWSRSFMNAPVSGLSAGISAVLSHAPLTCRNRSSWTRISGSKAEKSSGGAGLGDWITRPC